MTTKNKWFCDRFQGCQSIEDKDLDTKIFTWAARTQDKNVDLNIYETESTCKSNCKGPFSRCHGYLPGEEKAGFPLWTNDENQPQSWFYCDNNSDCRKYNKEDPCYCINPNCIPKDNKIPNDYWKYVGDNTIPDKCSEINKEFATTGSEWIPVDEDDKTTSDKPWKTSRGRIWPSVCDFTDKTFGYNCQNGDWREKDFCSLSGNPAAGIPFVRTSLMQMNGPSTPIIMDRTECTNNDLSGIKLPDLGVDNIIIMGDTDNGQYPKDYAEPPSKPKDHKWTRSGKDSYVNTQITHNTLSSGHNWFGSSFNITGDGYNIAQAPFNCDINKDKNPYTRNVIYPQIQPISKYYNQSWKCNTATGQCEYDTTSGTQTFDNCNYSCETSNYKCINGLCMPSSDGIQTKEECKRVCVPTPSPPTPPPPTPSVPGSSSKEIIIGVAIFIGLIILFFMGRYLLKKKPN